MPTEIVRGQVGRENTWNIGQESGVIAYMRGSIGDLPVRSEGLILGDGKALDDSCSRSEVAFHGEGRVADDAPSYAEFTVIMNS